MKLHRRGYEQLHDEPRTTNINDLILNYKELFYLVKTETNKINSTKSYVNIHG